MKIVVSRDVTLDIITQLALMLKSHKVRINELLLAETHSFKSGAYDAGNWTSIQIDF